ncbi:MAG: hypothetical protein PSV13_15750 [Lacunisphaera sp.]|nr:hypothetical protein [Lacunisphaera sp.]
MNEYYNNLQQISVELLICRSKHRECHHNLLRNVAASASTMAAKFSEDEMWLLLDVYARMPWRELQAIEVDAADPLCDEQTINGAFSQLLAVHIVNLVMVGSDARFVLPWAGQEGAMDRALELSDRVRTLPAGEAVALQVTLEAARLVPAGCISFGGWWHPPMMLRLLESPELDSPDLDRNHDNQ